MHSGLPQGRPACLLIQNMMQLKSVGGIDNRARPVNFAGLRMTCTDQGFVTKNSSRVCINDRVKQAKQPVLGQGMPQPLKIAVRFLRLHSAVILRGHLTSAAAALQGAQTVRACSIVTLICSLSRQQYRLNSAEGFIYLLAFFCNYLEEIIPTNANFCVTQ